MKYLVDINHWDLEGYDKQLKTILPRFNEETRKFLKHNSFHDGKVLSISIVNKADGEKKDPTTIKMIIEKYVEKENKYTTYEIKWTKVRKFYFDYDINRNVYSNKTDKIVCDGMRGIDEWGYDEILPLNEKQLQHEIFLFSQTTIIIHCSNIKIKKLSSKKCKTKPVL